MIQLKSLIESKCIRSFSIDLNSPLYLAYQKMSSFHLPYLVVVSNQSIVGLLLKDDYIDLLSNEIDISLVSPVHRLMNKHFYFANPDYELEETIRLMQKYKLQILPIVDDEIFLGVFTYTALLDCLAMQHSETIRSLFAYITGFDNFEPQKEIQKNRDLIKN